MSGIFRKVMCSDRLPKVENENYFTISEKGHEKIRFFNGTRFESAYHEGEVKWWLEEIELPSDEEIEKIANDSGAYRVEAGWFIEGFKVAIKGGKS